MKFSDLNKDQWTQLQPYLDTCVIPFTGLAGDEPPWKVTGALEQLGEMLDRLEKWFKGRIVIYPAVHYAGGSPDFAGHINGLCRKAKEGGFRYVVIAAASDHPVLAEVVKADLVLRQRDDSYIQRQVTELWQIALEIEKKV